MFRLFKLIRIFRKAPWFPAFKSFFQMNTGLIRLISFILSVLIIVHIVGCLWHFTAVLYNFDGTTWVVRNNLIDASNFSVYVASIYWAFSTLTTVGYGDISAETDLERIVAIFWMLLGVAFYTFVIGQLTALISNINSRR